MAIHQISVFLENRAGQLAEITALLAKNGVDLRAINIAETSDYGVLRLIASHEPEACRVLRENGFIFSTSDVVAVGVPDAPGGLSTLLQLLAENSIDVHYMYSIFGQPNGMACMILRVADPAAVSSLLALWQAALFLVVMNWFDGIVIDRLWVGRSPVWRIRGMGGIPYVKPWKTVLTRRALGTVVYLILAPAVAGLALLLGRLCT